MIQLGFIFSPEDIFSKSYNMQRDLDLVFTVASIHFSVKLTVQEYTWYRTIPADNAGLLQKQRHHIYQPTKPGYFPLY